MSAPWLARRFGQAALPCWKIRCKSNAKARSITLLLVGRATVKRPRERCLKAGAAQVGVDEAAGDGRRDEIRCSGEERDSVAVTGEGRHEAIAALRLPSGWRGSDLRGCCAAIASRDAEAGVAHE